MISLIKSIQLFVLKVLNVFFKTTKYDKRLFGFVMYNYINKDGTINYEKYRKIQETGNLRKINNTWVIEENIQYLSNFIKDLIKSPQFGICHGTRRGKEQEWFRKYLGCEVIGTEISQSAEQFPHTIRWDFHEVKPGWINSADFIYSNSLDHSYNPEKCLNTWMSCIKNNGLCIIEHSSLHTPSGTSVTDPFGADIAIMPFLILQWSKGKFSVRQILKAPVKNTAIDYLYFLIIQNNLN